MRRELIARIVVIALLGIVAPGCCGGPMPLDDMHARSLRTAYDTLDFFRTAVRYDELGRIWDLLSPRSQEEFKKKISPDLFGFVFGGFTMQDVYGDQKAPADYADLRLVELIHRSQIISVEPDERRPGSVVWVQLYLRLGEKPIPTKDTRFPLIRVPGAKPGEPGRWLVGVQEWIEWR